MSTNFMLTCRHGNIMLTTIARHEIIDCLKSLGAETETFRGKIGTKSAKICLNETN